MNPAHLQNPGRPEDTAVAPFPVRWLTGTLILTVAVLLAMGWSAFDSYRNFAAVQSRDLRLAELQGTIVHLEEVLTMSARMAAATGDLQWERRYRQFEAPLDEAVKETIRLTTQLASAAATQQTAAANLKLVEMENRAFALVAAGQAGEAKQVLFSDTYEAQKKIYAAGMAMLIRDIEARRAISEHDLWRRAVWFDTAALLAVALLVVTWWKVLGRLHQWRVALAVAVAALHRAREDLEQRVAERTSELQGEVTERQRAEEATRESEERFAGAFEHAPIGMVLVSPAGRFLKVNRVFCELVGYSEAELLERTFEEITCPEDRALSIENVRGAVAGEVRSFQVEKRYVHARGHLVPCLLSIALIRDGRGQPRYFSGQIQDITGRKRAEAALEKANAELVEASRMAGVAEFATGILHNVGNVLNSVNVASTCVADSLRRSKAANLAKVVTLLREHEQDLGDFFTNNPQGRQVPLYLAHLAAHLAGEQAGALTELAELQRNLEHIKEIVTTQQGMAGSGSAEAINVTGLVDDALKINSAGVTRHQIDVIKDCADLPAVSVEKNRALQILVNLIRNAKQACAASGQRVKTLTIRTTAGLGHVRIAVSDNGVGIPPENLPRIFTHGFTTKKDGHGYGLHSAALAAKEMGGALLVQSDGPGHGATFILELPVNLDPPSHENPDR